MWFQCSVVLCSECVNGIYILASVSIGQSVVIKKKTKEYIYYIGHTYSQVQEYVCY